MSAMFRLSSVFLWFDDILLKLEHHSFVSFVETPMELVKLDLKKKRESNYRQEWKVGDREIGKNSLIARAD